MATVAIVPATVVPGRMKVGWNVCGWACRGFHTLILHCSALDARWNWSCSSSSASAVACPIMIVRHCFASNMPLGMAAHHSACAAAGHSPYLRRRRWCVSWLMEEKMSISRCSLSAPDKGGAVIRAGDALLSILPTPPLTVDSAARRKRVGEGGRPVGTVADERRREFLFERRFLPRDYSAEALFSSGVPEVRARVGCVSPTLAKERAVGDLGLPAAAAAHS
eukprot:3599194-Rhodomonas_salina.1